MLVVKRPFKNLGRTYTAGSVITEPATIKRLKGKIAEGKIINVTEQTYKTAYDYFKSKYEVLLPSLIGELSTEEPVEETTEEPVEVKPAKAKAAKASVVSKK